MTAKKRTFFDKGFHKINFNREKDNDKTSYKQNSLTL